MKYIDEYRDPKLALHFAERIKKITTRSWRIMEICGGQTHSIIKYGIDELVSSHVTLIHGPGCPVCVTPSEVIDKAIEISLRKNVIFTSFGDMLRVPGSKESLLVAKSKGADVRFVYSPMDSLKIARDNPEKEVVFFAIGFETTTSANAMAIFHAKKEGLKNISFLVSEVLVPPAIKALLSSKNVEINGFLAAGHVCTVTGFKEYEEISKKFKIPIVVTGFEPIDLLQGIYMCVKQLEEGAFETQNQYSRSVKREGNINIINMINNVFNVVTKNWRGIGEIPESGLEVKEEYKDYDAELKFGKVVFNQKNQNGCIGGQILTGEKSPHDCPLFGKPCTPLNPLGATMVSNEGACAAYYKYRSKER